MAQHAQIALVSLLNQTLKYAKKHMEVLLIGVATFSLIFGGMQIVMNRQMASTMSQFMVQEGVDPELLEQINMRIASGDETAIEDLAGIIGSRFEGMSEEEIDQYMEGASVRAMQLVMPIFVKTMLISFIIIMVAYAYYFSHAVHGSGNAGTTFTQAFKSVFPLLGLGIWIALRSFLWIPFVGIITGIYYLPRLLAAAVIMLGEKKGILESARESMKRTKGYWGKLFIITVLFTMVLTIAQWLLIAVVSALEVVSSDLVVLANAFIMHIAMAIASIFIVQLALAVVGKKAAKKTT